MSSVKKNEVRCCLAAAPKESMTRTFNYLNLYSNPTCQLLEGRFAFYCILTYTDLAEKDPKAICGQRYPLRFWGGGETGQRRFFEVFWSLITVYIIRPVSAYVLLSECSRWCSMFVNKVKEGSGNMKINRRLTQASTFCVMPLWAVAIRNFCL